MAAPALSLVAIFLVLGSVTKSHAMPPNPQRAFTATTCHAAILRYCEALQGSPLISAAESAAIERQARAEMIRLCDPDTGAAPPPQPLSSRCNGKSSHDCHH